MKKQSNYLVAHAFPVTGTRAEFRCVVTPLYSETVDFDRRYRAGAKNPMKDIARWARGNGFSRCTIWFRDSLVLHTLNPSEHQMKGARIIQDFLQGVLRDDEGDARRIFNAVHRRGLSEDVQMLRLCELMHYLLNRVEIRESINYDELIMALNPAKWLIPKLP